MTLPFTGRLQHVGEFGEQALRVVGAQRAGAADREGQRGAVPEQEEQHIDHDAEADEELRRALPTLTALEAITCDACPRKEARRLSISLKVSR